MIDLSKIGSVYYHNRTSDNNFLLGKMAFNLKKLTEAKYYFSKALESYQALGAQAKVETTRKILDKINEYSEQKSTPDSPRSSQVKTLFNNKNSNPPTPQLPLEQQSYQPK